MELPKITTKIIVDLYEQIIADTNPSGEKKYETASRVKQVIGQIMRYGRAIGETQNDPTAGLMLQNPNKENHFASAKTDAEIKKLINLIYHYDFPIVRGALLFNALTFTRPGETRQARWDEIEFDRKIWRIPAIKMKSRREHLVPLSSQTLLVLEELKPFTCNQEWIFPSTRNGRPMSDGTAIAGLRRLGYQKGEITAHGFRHTASTRLNESALFSSDAIERQLAHHDKTVRGIYNSAEYWTERVKVMQWWGDFLWGLLDISHN